MKDWIKGNVRYIAWILIIVVFFIPLIIHFIAWVWSLKGFGVGAVEGWIGFWGSYLGGALSTVGVIATTYLILHRNDTAIELQDKKIRKKEYVFYELKQIEEANKILVQCSNLFLKLNDENRIITTKVLEANEFTNGKSMGSFDSKLFNEMVDEYREDIRIFSSLRGQYYELFELFKYKMSIFENHSTVSGNLSEASNKYFEEIQNAIRRLENESTENGHGDKLLDECLASIEDKKEKYLEIELEMKIELKSILMIKINEFKDGKL